VVLGQEDIMNISSLSGLIGLQQQQNIQKSSYKLGVAIAALVSGGQNSGTSGDISSLSVAGQLQSAVSGLKQVSSNLAQANSLAQVADGGLLQLQNINETIQNLAQQAGSPVLDNASRKALNEQFKQLVQQINETVANTSFNSKPLLNGNLSGAGKISLDNLLKSGANNSSNSGDLEIADLSSAKLLGGDNLNLNTIAAAGDVFAAAGNALQQIASNRTAIGSFLQSTDYATASIESAIANQEAARSTLQDADFATAATDKSQATLQNNISLALAAQTNRLTPALLQMLG
jgi:flagellin